MIGFDRGPSKAPARHLANAPGYTAPKRKLFWYDSGPRSSTAGVSAARPGWHRLRPWSDPADHLPHTVGDAGQRLQGLLSKLGLTPLVRARLPARRRESRCAATVRAAPAAPRARRRARPRARPAQRHPAPARPHQPRHHLYLRTKDRQRPDHRRRPRPQGADDPGQHRSPRLGRPRRTRRRLVRYWSRRPAALPRSSVERSHDMREAEVKAVGSCPWNVGVSGCRLDDRVLSCGVDAGPACET
jgi:hypothetical protein